VLLSSPRNGGRQEDAVVPRGRLLHVHADRRVATNDSLPDVAVPLLMVVRRLGRERVGGGADLLASER
jgi:hypothetical protein